MARFRPFGRRPPSDPVDDGPDPWLDEPPPAPARRRGRSPDDDVPPVPATRSASPALWAPRRPGTEPVDYPDGPVTDPFGFPPVPPVLGAEPAGAPADDDAPAWAAWVPAAPDRPRRDTGDPGAGRPAPEAPDTGRHDTGRRSGAGHPGVERPGVERPGARRQTSGRSGVERPDTGRPGAGRPGEPPGAGDRAGGHPDAGPRASGRPGTAPAGTGAGPDRPDAPDEREPAARSAPRSWWDAAAGAVRGVPERSPLDGPTTRAADRAPGTAGDADPRATTAREADDAGPTATVAGPARAVRGPDGPAPAGPDPVGPIGPAGAVAAGPGAPESARRDSPGADPTGPDADPQAGPGAGPGVADAGASGPEAAAGPWAAGPRVAGPAAGEATERPGVRRPGTPGPGEDEPGAATRRAATPVAAPPGGAEHGAAAPRIPVSGNAPSRSPVPGNAVSGRATPETAAPDVAEPEIVAAPGAVVAGPPDTSAVPAGRGPVTGGARNPSPPRPVPSDLVDHADAAALAGAFAADYLSWDEDDPARRGRALAEHLPGPAADRPLLGWSGHGRQRAEIVLPGAARPDGEGRVLVDVRVRVTPYRRVSRSEGGPEPEPDEPLGGPAAAPSVTARGWRGLAARWVRLGVTIARDGDRLVVDAGEETIDGTVEGTAPQAPARPARSGRGNEDPTLDGDEVVPPGPSEEPAGSRAARRAGSRR